MDSMRMVAQLPLGAGLVTGMVNYRGRILIVTEYGKLFEVLHSKEVDPFEIVVTEVPLVELPPMNGADSEG